MQRRVRGRAPCRRSEAVDGRQRRGLGVAQVDSRLVLVGALPRQPQRRGAEKQHTQFVQQVALVLHRRKRRSNGLAGDDQRHVRWTVAAVQHVDKLVHVALGVALRQQPNNGIKKTAAPSATAHSGQTVGRQKALGQRDGGPEHAQHRQRYRMLAAVARANRRVGTPARLLRAQKRRPQRVYNTTRSTNRPTQQLTYKDRNASTEPCTGRAPVDRGGSAQPACTRRRAKKPTESAVEH